eukprot:scaffold3479_cov106-Cylindrotheca_fusiformis.AAC.5
MSDSRSNKRQRTLSSVPTAGSKNTAADDSDDESFAFTINCSGDEPFVVSPEMSVHLQDACDYFRTVFLHNTIETETRVINKPDWTFATVTLLFTLILKGTVSVTELSELVAVTSAADQVLLEYNLYSPFEQGQLLSPEIKSLFIELADPSKAVFTFTGPSRILADWKNWLQKGIFHSIDWKMFVLARQNNPNELRHNEMGRNFYYVHHMNYTEWQVHAYSAVAAVQHLGQALKRVTIEPEEEEFYKLGILYPHADINESLAVEVAQATDGRSFSATFWDEVSTLCGPFSTLHQGFRTMRRHLKQNKAILRIKSSSPIVISRIIEACCYQCEDHKGSIGIDITGSIVLIKTIYDMSSILKFLAETTPTSEPRECDDTTGANISTAEIRRRKLDEEDAEAPLKEPFEVKHIDGDCFVLDASSIESF